MLREKKEHSVREPSLDFESILERSSDEETDGMTVSSQLASAVMFLDVP